MELNPAERFKNSELDTLVFYSDRYSAKNINAKTFALQCNKDFAAPTTEILSISEIKTIRFERLSKLNIPLIFTMLSEMPKLENLHFYHSAIKSLPPEIGKMRQLRSLTLEWDISGSLKSSEMRPVPPEFGDLENLRELNLIHCSSFYKGFPAESLNLQNLKSVKFIDDYRTLPANMEFLPNLEHLYFSGAKINPPDIEPVLREWNTMKSVTIKDSFHRFEELIGKYPPITFYNDGQKFSEELAEFWDEPEKLPAVGEFLMKERTDGENAQYAYLVMNKHFARAGIALRKTDVPVTLSSFGTEFYMNVDNVLRKSEHALMLRIFFVELTDFYEAFSGEFFAYNLLGFLKNFIDRDPPRSFITPLLPSKALARFGDIEQAMDDDHERYLEILNQQGY